MYMVLECPSNKMRFVVSQLFALFHSKKDRQPVTRNSSKVVNMTTKHSHILHLNLLQVTEPDTVIIISG